MKTRIISAVVMISFVIAVLTVGKMYFPPLITFFIALICGCGIYEITSNVAKIKPLRLSVISSIYGGIMVFLLDKQIYEFLSVSKNVYQKLPLAFTLIYFLFAVVVILREHKDFSLDKIFCFSAFPLFISYGFSCLNGIISADRGIYYLLLLLNFASICDTGAYFTGSFLGKTKLCPEISPKKTVEGAIGGILSSLIVSIILVFSFNSDYKLLTLIFTIPLCIVGMLGDLFASTIKRSVGLKDYSNLIPGHGGVLDRFDSMLLIAPVLYVIMEFGVI